MKVFIQMQKIRSSVWLVLTLIVLVMSGPAPSHAQLPFIDPEQALAQMIQQLQITEAQQSAFRAAMARVDARREAFRDELTRLAGGSGVDMDTLLAYAERMQQDSESYLVDVLTPQQMEVFREMNSFAPIAIN
ncbi:MAG: hypothetical protein Q8L20_14450 [Gammaproteobacteria bacterium]|nr:hypothetical protein [Gammaproteobacteria bacterium]